MTRHSDTKFDSNQQNDGRKPTFSEETSRFMAAICRNFGAAGTFVLSIPRMFVPVLVRIFWLQINCTSIIDDPKKDCESGPPIYARTNTKRPGRFFKGMLDDVHNLTIPPQNFRQRATRDLASLLNATSIATKAAMLERSKTWVAQKKSCPPGYFFRTRVALVVGGLFRFWPARAPFIQNSHFTTS